MISWITILVLYEHASVFIQTCMQYSKEYLRHLVGSEPITEVRLYKTGAVIPNTIQAQCFAEEPYAIYKQRRIYSTAIPEDSAPFARLPYSSIVVRSGEEEIDLSDWCCDVRTNILCPPLITLLRIAAIHHGVQIDEQNPDTRIHVISRSGDETAYRYVGDTSLVVSA